MDTTYLQLTFFFPSLCSILMSSWDDFNVVFMLLCLINLVLYATYVTMDNLNGSIPS